jgi:hypothetical protein
MVNIWSHLAGPRPQALWGPISNGVLSVLML